MLNLMKKLLISHSSYRVFSLPFLSKEAVPVEISLTVSCDQLLNYN